jgi:hypothetical protein
MRCANFRLRCAIFLTLFACIFSNGPQDVRVIQKTNRDKDASIEVQQNGALISISRDAWQPRHTMRVQPAALATALTDATSMDTTMLSKDSDDEEVDSQSGSHTQKGKGGKGGKGLNDAKTHSGDKGRKTRPCCQGTKLVSCSASMVQTRPVATMDATLKEKPKPSTHVNNNWLRINNKDYSRRNAHEASLGKVGPVHGGWIPPLLINFQLNPPPEWLVDNVNVSGTTVSLTSGEAAKLSAHGKIKAPIVGAEFAAGIKSASCHAASYKLQQITFKEKYKIATWVNQNRNSAFMHQYMGFYRGTVNKPRIVTTVWVAIETSPEYGSHCVGGDLTMTYKNVGFEISGKKCQHSVWQFSEDSVVAFEPSFLEFEHMHPLTQPPRGRVRFVATNVVER